MLKGDSDVLILEGHPVTKTGRSELGRRRGTSAVCPRALGSASSIVGSVPAGVPPCVQCTGGSLGDLLLAQLVFQ